MRLCIALQAEFNQGCKIAAADPRVRLKGF